MGYQASRPLRRPLQVQPTSHPPRDAEETRALASTVLPSQRLTELIAGERQQRNHNLPHATA